MGLSGKAKADSQVTVGDLRIRVPGWPVVATAAGQDPVFYRDLFLEQPGMGLVVLVRRTFSQQPCGLTAVPALTASPAGKPHGSAGCRYFHHTDKEHHHRHA